MADIVRVLPELEGQELSNIAALIRPLTDEQGLIFATGYRERRKKLAVAWLLYALLILWLCGIHRFYLRSIGLGVVYLLTAGLFGIGLIVDLFLINSMTRAYNMQVAQEMLLLVQHGPARTVPIDANTSTSIRAKFCSECGNPLEVSNRFCPECGKAQ